MLSRMLVGVCLLALVASASAQMMRRGLPVEYEEPYENEFDSQGLEVLEARYGQAYPGYAGAGSSALQYGLGGSQIGLSNVQLQQQQLMQQQQLQQPMFGNVGMDNINPIYGNVGMDNINPIYGNVGVDSMSWTQQQPLSYASLAQQGPAVNFAQIPQVQNVGFQQTFQQQPIAQLSGVQTWQQQQIPRTFGAGIVQQPVQQDFSQELLLTQQNLAANVGMLQSQLRPQMYGATTSATSTIMPSYGLSMPTSQLGVVGATGSYGGIGALGAGNAQLGTSKKTTTAQPIYAQSMVVPKIITQPILRPHTVSQPILQQQLIQQPIVETRQVIQPVIRRIITQPIIRPEIYESTTIQPTLKTETTVQPHIVQQTVVTPQLQNQYEEQAAITEAAKTNVASPVVQPTVSAKQQSGGLGGMMSGLF